MVLWCHLLCGTGEALPPILQNKFETKHAQQKHFMINRNCTACQALTLKPCALYYVCRYYVTSSDMLRHGFPIPLNVCCGIWYQNSSRSSPVSCVVGSLKIGMVRLMLNLIKICAIWRLGEHHELFVIFLKEFLNICCRAAGSLLKKEGIPLP